MGNAEPGKLAGGHLAAKNMPPGTCIQVIVWEGQGGGFPNFVHYGGATPPRTHHDRASGSGALAPQALLYKYGGGSPLAFFPSPVRAPMDRYVVIGNPVSHSLSPAIHAMFARATGEAIEYATLA